MTFEWPKFNLEFSVPANTILLCVAGSHSYGTNTENSDVDYKGIIIPPKIYYTSPFRGFEQTSWKGGGTTGRVSEVEGVVEADEEGTLFGIQKFVHLASACNPNVVETLFVDERHILLETDAGKTLRENRELFLSQRACKTFTGYALSQLKRIKTHKSWVDNPPAKAPTRAEFDLPEHKVIPHEQQNAARAFVQRHLNTMAPWLLDADNQHRGEFWEGLERLVELALNEHGLRYDEKLDTWLEIENRSLNQVANKIGFDENFVIYLQNEKKFAQAKQHYEQYQAWKKNRNAARAELESRYGYDVKHAMHLVRLLRMGEEILRVGDFKVFRPDREELKEIRNGAWSYDELIVWSEKKVDELYELVRSGKSAVPKNPDQDALEKLVVELQEKHWIQNGN